MTKKITAKQFKDLFEKANMPFDIWGYEGIINLVIMGLRRCADNERKLGFDSLAQVDDEKIDVLMNYLTEIGYFE